MPPLTQLQVKEKRSTKKSSKKQHKPHPSSSVSCAEEQHPELEGIKPENMRSVERVAELEQVNSILVEQVKVQASTIEKQEKAIKELQTQNRNLKDNLARMEGDLASHQEGMKNVVDKLRDEKEQLESNLSILHDEKEQLETKLYKLHDEKEKLEAKLSE